MIEKINFGDPIGAMASSDTCIDNCWEHKMNCTLWECIWQEGSKNDIDYQKLVNSFYREINV